MAAEYDSSKALHEAQGKARRLTVNGEFWLVYELPPLQFDRRSAPSLIFENEGIVRRVRTFPPNWRELTDADLLALSWSA